MTHPAACSAPGNRSSAAHGVMGPVALGKTSPPAVAEHSERAWKKEEGRQDSPDKQGPHSVQDLVPKSTNAHAGCRWWGAGAGGRKES